MIKSITIVLFFLLLGTTCVMSQSNTSIHEKYDSATVINNPQQTGQFNQLINTKSDSVSFSTGKINPHSPQIPIEKAYLDVKKAKKDKEQMENKSDSLKIQ